MDLHPWKDKQIVLGSWEKWIMLADNYKKKLKTSSGCGAAPALCLFTLPSTSFSWKKCTLLPVYWVMLALDFWLDNSYTMQWLNQSKQVGMWVYLHWQRYALESRGNETWFLSRKKTIVTHTLDESLCHQNTELVRVLICHFLTEVAGIVWNVCSTGTCWVRS